jgi:arylsulfatase A-like enzyme
VALAVGVLAPVVGCGNDAARARAQDAPTQPFSRPSVLLITIDALRPDHLGAYGYRRDTSPHLDAFARAAAVFERSYTYWPKTRGSFAALLTGRTSARSGYSARHPGIPAFNPTLASVLRDAGYRTIAAVDNPNVGSVHGYGKGFDSYRETWEERGLATEVDRARAITETGLRALSAPSDRPLFLWLHYVNPHAPYAPPVPFDTVFLDAQASAGPRLPAVDGFRGGVRKDWAVPGRDRLGYYVAQYDGEIAAADREVGRILDAWRTSPAAQRTVVVVTSDHGESLGEHGYYFDHGPDLFDPCLHVPLLMSVPGAAGGTRLASLASTLDIVPTVLDAVKVSYPPGLSGRSLLPALMGRTTPIRERLLAQTTEASPRPSTRVSS